MNVGKKRVLVSLGAGILIIVIASFVILLAWRILYSPEWMTSAIVWIIAWPLRLPVTLFGIPYPGKGWLLFAVFVGIAIDVALLSGLIYAALSLVSRKAHHASPPPPPVPFQ